MQMTGQTNKTEEKNDPLHQFGGHLQHLKNENTGLTLRKSVYDNTATKTFSRQETIVHRTKELFSN